MSPATRDPARTRAALIDAALQGFAEAGFEGTSIKDIAARAQLSPGLLYHYFPSKEALLRALFERSQGLILGVFAEVAAEPDPHARLERLIRASVRVMREQLDFFRLSAQVRGQPAVMAALGVDVGAWEQALVATFEALLAEVGIPRPALRARLLIGALDGVCLHFALDPEGYPLEEVGEELLERLGPTPTGGKKS